MRVLLFDANNTAYRAFMTRQFSTSTGIGTSVLHGMLTMIRSTLFKFQTKEFVVIWDYGKAKWRMDLHPEYKGGRVRDDSYAEFLTQVNETHEVFEQLGFSQIRIPGCEADDIISIAARLITDKVKGSQAIIVSQDKDLLQCVSDSVLVWRPTKRELKDPTNLDPPAHLQPLFKALMGDKSDNIQGARQIGEKTALAAIAHGLRKIDLEQGMDSFEGGEMVPLKFKDMPRGEKIFAQRDAVISAYKLVLLPTRVDELGDEEQIVRLKLCLRNALKRMRGKVYLSAEWLEHGFVGKYELNSLWPIWFEWLSDFKIVLEGKMSDHQTLAIE